MKETEFMSLEQAIHNRWATDGTLSALLPAGRLFTGRAEGELELPYAVLERQETKPSLRTSSGTTIDEVQLRITIWSVDLDTAQSVAAAVEQRFDGADFTLFAAVRLMRRTNRREQIDADGRWRVELDFRAIEEHG